MSFSKEQITEINDAYVKQFTKNELMGPSAIIQLPEINTLSVKHEVIKFYRSRGVSNELIDYLPEHQLIAIYTTPYISKLTRLLDVTPIVTEDYPNKPPFSAENEQIFEKLNLIQEKPFQSIPASTGLSFKSFQSELNHSLLNFGDDITIIDFEAFWADGPHIPSEVGAVRIQNGQVSHFHGFFRPPTEFPSGVKPEITFKITNIPYQADATLNYIEPQALLDFIGNSVLYAKNGSLEKLILTVFSKKNVKVFEVQPIIFAKFGDISVKGNGERCQFHRGVEGHCALEDADCYANLLQKMKFD